MARPIKNSCDYFPHDADMRNHKKVKAIRNKFANGFAIWVMILEYLTSNDGNVFEDSDMEYELMSGDFGFEASEIIDVVKYCLLMEMLFLKDGFIFSESLNDRLEPVYLKRGRAKELSAKQLRKNGQYCNSNPEQSEVSVTETPQSKVNKRKLNKSKIFIPPLLEDVKFYCKEKGYVESLAIRFFDYYTTSDWEDKAGNQILNWKQKLISVWFKDEHKISNAPKNGMVF